ncbi:MAG TPA: FG-GAP-like repeat-containing protein [Bacteroidia bacterium]|nr:FG-GAP-like repeat-containing protein [Bacteroidia bacterium]
MKTNITTVAFLISLFSFAHGMFAQGPSVSDFNPKAGSYNTPVMIIGSGFHLHPDSNYVYFGNVKATVDSCSNTALYVRVPSGAQYKKISVTANYQTASSLQLFKPRENCMPSLSSASFKTPFFLPPAGLSFPVFPVIADFDLDGKPDVATVSKSGTLQKINVYKNNTITRASMDSTSFTKLADINTISSGSAAGGTNIAIGDIDGDGKQDIVVPGGNHTIVGVHRNTGSPGTIQFDQVISIATSGLPIFAALADIDRDGKLDIVTITSGASPALVVHRNLKTSPGPIIATDFAAAVTFPLPGTNGASHMDIEDLDGDGKLDIAVACSSAASIRVFRNNSTSGIINDSSLTASYTFATTNVPMGIRLMDVDGDNKADIVYSRVRVPVFSMPDSIVTVHRNLITTSGAIGTGSFSGPFHFPIRLNNNAHYFDMADFDGDLKPDIVTPNFLPATISVSKNTSIGSTISLSAGRLPLISHPKFIRPTGIAIGDLNGDNMPDIVCINQGQGIFTPSIAVIEGIKYAVHIQSVNANPICAGNNITLSYTALGTPINVNSTALYLLLSDSNGSFGNMNVISSKSGFQSGNITAQIPQNTAPGNRYRILLTPSKFLSACVDTGYPIQIISAGNFTPIITSSYPTGAITLCTGDSVQLKASPVGNFTYQWMRNNTNILLATDSIYYAKDSGNYIVIIRTNGGCQGNSNIQNIALLPLPAKPVINKNGNTLETSLGYSYQWMMNNLMLINDTHYTITPTQSGNFTVRITDSNGCSNTSDPYSFLTSSGSIENKQPLTVYPNPNKGVFAVTYSTPSSERILITLTDVCGKTVFNKYIQTVPGENRMEINLDNKINSGVYLFQYHNTHRSGHVKVMVE